MTTPQIKGSLRKQDSEYPYHRQTSGIYGFFLGKNQLGGGCARSGENSIRGVNSLYILPLSADTLSRRRLLCDCIDNRMRSIYILLSSFDGALFFDPCKALPDRRKQHDTEYVEALYGVSPPRCGFPFARSFRLSGIEEKRTYVCSIAC